MSGHLGSYLEDLIADWLRGTNFPSVPTVRIGLSTADPTDGGSGITEPGGSYARQPITFGTISIANDPGVQMANDALIQFTGLGASTITHVFIITTGDDLLWHAPITSVKAVQAGSTFDFQAGDISVTIGGVISAYLGENVLDWMKGSAMPAAPAALSMALSKADPTRDNSGFNEVGTSIGYTRQAVAFGAPSSLVGTGTSMSNSAAVTFGPATTGTWGSVTHGVIYDDVGTPNPLLYGPLSSPKNVVIGEGIGWAPGAIALLIK